MARESENASSTLRAAGSLWHKSRHVAAEDTDDPGHLVVQDAHTVFVLEQWFATGLRSDPLGIQTRHYLGFVAELGKVVRVVTSTTRRLIITRHLDGAATDHWKSRNKGYFIERYQQLVLREPWLDP